jgi:hypothetical protein
MVLLLLLLTNVVGLPKERLEGCHESVSDAEFEFGVCSVTQRRFLFFS